MTPMLRVLVCLGAWLLPLSASATCSALWADYSGKGGSVAMSLEGAWSLGELKAKRPSALLWTRRPGRDATGTRNAELQWVEQTAMEAERIDNTGLDNTALHVHWIRYSPSQALLAWGRNDAALCPVLIIDGDAAIVEAINTPEPVAHQGPALFNVRIMVSGNGRLQESLFVGELDGALATLEQESFLPCLHADGVRLYHRGGGFCGRSLTWQNAAGQGGRDDWRDLWRVHYRWQGRALRVASTELVPGGAAALQACNSR